MKARILVIEDEMSINDLLCMNLEIAGYETVGYLDGNEAYEAIIQEDVYKRQPMDKSEFRSIIFSEKKKNKIKKIVILIILMIFVIGCCISVSYTHLQAGLSGGG